MIAKSTLQIGGIGTARSGQHTRHLVSTVVLVASLLALFLVVHTHHGPVQVRNPFQPALPLDAIRADRQAHLSPPVMAFSPTDEGRYRALSEYLGKRYRVSPQVIFDLVNLAHKVGHQHKLDPLLIIAVMGVESSFNPIAESRVGAKGLMQIIPQFHGDKLEPFGGEKAVFDPSANLVVGAQILKEYLRRTGNLSIALQMYNGALADPKDEYTHRVLNERQRLHGVLARWSAPAVAAHKDPARTALVNTTQSSRFR
ncbi:MAG TPA: transglycosylase SLT domain-containing protein [Burkholderiales bacterium]|nr:transglycosylase SLT domain-containing protein [Burkholderiales bacterium]